MAIPLADQIRVYHDPGKKQPTGDPDADFTKDVKPFSNEALQAAQKVAEQFVAQSQASVSTQTLPGMPYLQQQAKPPWAPMDLRLSSQVPQPVALHGYPRALVAWGMISQAGLHQLRRSEQLALARAILANTVQWASTEEGHDYWGDHNTALAKLAHHLVKMGV